MLRWTALGTCARTFTVYPASSPLTLGFSRRWVCVVPSRRTTSRGPPRASRMTREVPHSLRRGSRWRWRWRKQPPTPSRRRPWSNRRRWRIASRLGRLGRRWCGPRRRQTQCPGLSCCRTPTGSWRRRPCSFTTTRSGSSATTTTAVAAVAAAAPEAAEVASTSPAFVWCTPPYRRLLLRYWARVPSATSTRWTSSRPTACHVRPPSLSAASSRPMPTQRTCSPTLPRWLTRWERGGWK
mmetsp:Transcript_38118/g.94529  ORF Transcript_38118/g.94529 Transcript_38118/m.94529 type:complete len:239 (+) Transcript_38118:359-1075(+)